jgi:hypothetical protein
MTTNKYATLRGTIARAKRNDCQKVVMRVTLVEELLLQLSNAEKQVAALAAEVQAVRWAAGQVYSAGYNHGHLNTADELPYASDEELLQRGNEVLIEFTDPDHSGNVTDAVLDEVRAHAIKSALNDCSSASIGTASWIRTASVMKMLHSVKRVLWHCMMRYFARSVPYEFRHHRSGKRAGRAPPAAGHTKTPY